MRQPLLFYTESKQIAETEAYFAVSNQNGIVELFAQRVIKGEYTGPRLEVESCAEVEWLIR